MTRVLIVGEAPNGPPLGKAFGGLPPGGSGARLARLVGLADVREMADTVNLLPRAPRWDAREARRSAEVLLRVLPARRLILAGAGVPAGGAPPGEPCRRPGRGVGSAPVPDAPPPIEIHETVMLRLADLQPHPQNYRAHPPDQIIQLEASLREHGVVRNVVVARNTILVGHGIVETARQAGMDEFPGVYLDIDPFSPRALRLLAGENELQRLAVVDDRGLSELLRSVKEQDPDVGLLGTGFDDAMLANLVLVTRPASEIRTIDEAAQWVGMPDFVPAGEDILLVIHCDTEEERAQLIEQIGVHISKKMRQTWSAWWPPRVRKDLNALRFDGVAGEPATAP